MEKYASIIIDISIKSLDRPFTYIIPFQFFDSVDVGSVVKIPFGAANRTITGYVIDVLNQTDLPQNKLKEIIEVNETYEVEAELIKLSYWMKKRYLCSFSAALKSVIPSKHSINKKYNRSIHFIGNEDEVKEIIEKIAEQERFLKRRKTLELLLEVKLIQEKELIKQTGIGKAGIQSLIKKGIIEVKEEETYRNPFNIDSIEKTENLLPNYDQQKAIYDISRAVREDLAKVFLLHGITGSGKTEVYMQIIDQVLEDGKQAIVLIPEISLTPQTVNYFIGRFGNQVGLMHSKLSQGEKYDQWRKAKEGKISIMVGPRSAVFAPFTNIGVIIIDEEHETTYKSSSSPRYHAREVAIKRGNMETCPVVLGSATPLIESYYKALQGKYDLYELKNKAKNTDNLSVDIVDMREELEEGNKSIFSQLLRDKIEEALNKKEQIILFLNRRGYANFVSCRKCGHVVKCTNCDVPYTYHASDDRLVCHYCGKAIKNVKTCPNCDSKYIREFGIGTQKVENYVKKEFSGARVLRMDMDTTVGKNSYQQILDDFGSCKADILIGTQMIAKGHHFENVTLVGVIAADLSLYMNDFRATERTFQLITQVTGRTGRGLKKGQAIIQTYSPDHYSIVCSKEQDYKKFYEEEITYRKIMGYPPFTNIMTIMLFSEKEKELIRDSYKIKDLLVELVGNNDVRLLGPSPANVSKVKQVFRWKIIVKSGKYSILQSLSDEILKQKEKRHEWKHISVQIDINSMFSF